MSMGGMGGEVRIAVNIQNADRIKQLNNDIRDQTYRIRELNKASQEQGKSQADFLKAAQPMAKHIQVMTAEIRHLKREMGQSDEAMNRFGRNMGRGGKMGMGMMQLGYAIDDLQYGQLYIQGHAA